MKKIRRLAMILILAAAGLIGNMPQKAAAYNLNDMVLRDANGNPIAVGSKTPYSPKRTCGTVGCHIDMARSFGMTSGNVYESEVAYATKDHGTGTSTYSVPYPLHGVSASYHFQRGRNVPWGQTQRDFYRDLAFTSSPGGYGGYCSTYNRQLADLDEMDATRFDMSSSDYGHSECGWCHGGGGPLEYDREGYRYDGLAGLFQTGLNPVPKQGDYFRFDPVAGSLVNSVAEWQSGGVAEVDCLLCHLNTDGIRYGLVERNFAISESRMPGLAASVGLAGASGTAGYLNIARQAGDGVNPDISQSLWSWATTSLDHAVIISPRKENCALCHVADKSHMTAGPAGIPLGFTTFQKILPAGSVDDGDLVNSGKNSTDWKTAKPRADAASRGMSINDPNNPDVHMDSPAAMQCTTCHYILGTPRDYDTDCLYCHYEMWGYTSPPPVTPVLPTPFSALTDTSGTVIQPSVGVFRIDHQFAKGDSTPDGKNMDQLDNTVTCQSCHVDRTHPSSSGAPDPAPVHTNTAIPSFHFEKISCKTCHIPILNGPVAQGLIDFTAGPYQTFERTQSLEVPAAGIGKRPLYLWRMTGHGKGRMEIQPFSVTSVAVWADSTSQTGEESGAVSPTYQRIGKKAAEQLRAAYGDANGDGVYDWTLNRPQGGDTALIVNTPTEIADFITQMSLIPGAPANPVIHFSFEQFSISHHVRPPSLTANATLGSSRSGGCLMCHSSSDPASPYYSPQSVGFFDKPYELFKQPLDGGVGLVQTTLPAHSPLSGDLKRIDIKFPYLTSDGTLSAVNLSNNNGQTVGNIVNQGEILGYDPVRLASLMNPASISYPVTATAGPNGAISPADTTTVLGGTSLRLTITPAAGYRVADVLVDGVSVGAMTSYTFYGVVATHTISATFTPDVYTITAAADVNGSISPSGTLTVNSGVNQTFAITPSSGYQVSNVIVDSAAMGAITSYTFTNVSANHTINAYFQTATYTITATAGSGGSISPSGTNILNVGASQTFTITPSAGYSISSVLVDGSSVGPVSSYTFTNVTANHSISASFMANTGYTITASVVGNGAISPSGSVSVLAGANKTFTITPAAGYRVADVQVDGASVGARTSYTFYSVQANHTIAATFVLNVYTITATANGPGTLTPSGTITVNPGDSLTFTITPDAGHQVVSLIDNGTAKYNVTIYTINNIATDHTINAYFK